MELPLSHRFRIIFSGLDTSSQEETGFQSIVGLETALHVVPGTRQEGQDVYASAFQPTLVLRRAVKHYSESPLTRWLHACFNDKQAAPLPEAVIELLDASLKPYMGWTIRSILPKSWKLGELNAEKTEVLIETIELTYQELLFRK